MRIRKLSPWRSLRRRLRRAGYESLEAAAADGVAFVFMGHGTSHTANVTYDQMQAQMQALGYANVFIGTRGRQACGYRL